MGVYHSTPSLHAGNLRSHLRKMCDSEFLSDEDARELATEWQKNRKQPALDKLVRSHMRLVIKISRGYMGYGIPLEDLISESTVGIIHAIDHYDPTRKMKVSSYVAFYVKAVLYRFVFQFSRIVRFGSSSKDSRMFFNMRRMRNVLNMSDEEIAQEFGMSVEEIHEAKSRLSSRDFSLNETCFEDGEEFISRLRDENQNAEEIALHKDEYNKRKNILHNALSILSPREREVFTRYRLSEKRESFQSIASDLGISAEGVRRADMRAFDKLSEYVYKSVTENAAGFAVAAFVILSSVLLMVCT